MCVRDSGILSTLCPTGRRLFAVSSLKLFILYLSNAEKILEALTKVRKSLLYHVAWWKNGWKTSARIHAVSSLTCHCSAVTVFWILHQCTFQTPYLSVDSGSCSFFSFVSVVSPLYLPLNVLSNFGNTSSLYRFFLLPNKGQIPLDLSCLKPGLRPGFRLLFESTFCQKPVSDLPATCRKPA